MVPGSGGEGLAGSLHGGGSFRIPGFQMQTASVQGERGSPQGKNSAGGGVPIRPDPKFASHFPRSGPGIRRHGKRHRGGKNGQRPVVEHADGLRLRSGRGRGIIRADSQRIQIQGSGSGGAAFLHHVKNERPGLIRCRGPFHRHIGIRVRRVDAPFPRVFRAGTGGGLKRLYVHMSAGYQGNGLVRGLAAAQEKRNGIFLAGRQSGEGNAHRAGPDRHAVGKQLQTRIQGFPMIRKGEGAFRLQHAARLPSAGFPLFPPR